MPRGEIEPHVVTRAGLDRADIVETDGVAADGHYVTNRTNMWLEVRNSNGAATARTVTFLLAGAVDGQSVTPRTKELAAGETWMLGPWPANMYSGQLLIDVDHADLKIAAFQLG